MSTIGPNIVIESLIFGDDILAAGNKNCIERTGRNLRAMEIQKKFTFSRDKTKIIKVVNKKNSREEIPAVEVEQGRIRESTAEKYLGEWFDTKGTNEIKIKKKEEKVGHMIQEVKR